VSAATPDDPAVSDGFYWLYGPKAGSKKVTAAAPRYATTPSAVTVSSKVAVHDVVLPAGRLKVSADTVSLRTPLSGRASEKLTLKNTGEAPLHVTLAEQSTSTDGIAARPGPAGTWQQLPDYPKPVTKGVVGTYQGRIYSVGGANSIAVTTLYKHVYDPAAGAWSPIADMPETKSEATGAFVNGTLYVVGGATQPHPGADAVLTAAAHAYHPYSDTWSRIADVPEAVDGAAAAVLDGSRST
jgi:hypothetical protein